MKAINWQQNGKATARWLLMLSCTAFYAHAASASTQAGNQAQTSAEQHVGTTTQACSLEALQGTWELASARYLDKTGTVVGSISAGSTFSRKVVAGRHMAFITWQPDGRFEVAASGTVQIEQGRYVERIDTASKPRLIGKTYRFACQLHGDMWQHSGDEDGIHIEEQWQRVK
jgi:hypothetical protein